jgi:hypothetical protein
MREQVILVFFVGATLFGLVHGVLAMSSPDMHRRFVFRLNFLSRSKLVLSEHTGGLIWQIEYRLGGALLTLVSGGLCWVALRELSRNLLNFELHDPVGTLSLAALISLVGLAIIAKPHYAYQLAMRGLRPRPDSMPEPKQIQRGMRLMGVLVLFAVASLLVSQIKHK